METNAQRRGRSSPGGGDLTMKNHPICHRICSRSKCAKCPERQCHLSFRIVPWNEERNDLAENRPVTLIDCGVPMERVTGERVVLTTLSLYRSVPSLFLYRNAERWNGKATNPLAAKTQVPRQQKAPASGRRNSTALGAAAADQARPALPRKALPTDSRSHHRPQPLAAPGRLVAARPWAAAGN